MSVDFTQPISSVTIYNLFLYFVPGYVTIHILAFILHYKFKISFNEKTAISVITSVVFYIVLSVIFEIKLEGWNYLYLFLPIGVIFAITIVCKRKYRRHTSSDTAWVSFGKRNIGRYVEIVTTNNKKYYGYISIISNEANTTHDICLKDPYIFQDKTTYDIGDEILFLQHTIAFIRVLQVV